MHEAPRDEGRRATETAGESLEFSAPATEAAHTLEEDVGTVELWHVSRLGHALQTRPSVFRVAGNSTLAIEMAVLVHCERR